MRLQFLRCREAWLTGILEDLDQKNAREYFKRHDKLSQNKIRMVDCCFTWAHESNNIAPEDSEDYAPKDSLKEDLYQIFWFSACTCAMGHAWVGLDFWGLLPPLFEE
ncbi:conserved oligomeric Golgi complex component-related protein [Raphanus sativus]|nr:conserved oligomeric Golgi complex component-related protein [Raphanus sativus]